MQCVQLRGGSQGLVSRTNRAQAVVGQRRLSRLPRISIRPRAGEERESDRQQRQQKETEEEPRLTTWCVTNVDCHACVLEKDYLLT